MKHVLLAVCLVGCGGSDAGVNGLLDQSPTLQADAAAFDSGSAIGSGQPDAAGDAASLGDAFAQDASPADDASSQDAGDAAPPADAGVDASNCPQGCTLPNVCGGSGAPHNCGDACMNNPNWFDQCRAKAGIVPLWAAPAGCPFIYDVNGGTVSYRPNGVSGCTTIEVDSGTPIYCCT